MQSQRFDVDLLCLLCADERRLTVGDLTQIQPLPMRCQHCRGGTVVAISVAARYVVATVPKFEQVDLFVYEDVS